MKRLLSMLILLLLVLTACGRYDGVVTEKKESSFIVTTPSKNAEEAAELEMHLTELSVFSGSISSYEELKEGDQVRVIPLNTEREFPWILVSEVVVE